MVVSAIFDKMPAIKETQVYVIDLDDVKAAATVDDRTNHSFQPTPHFVTFRLGSAVLATIESYVSIVIPLCGNKINIIFVNSIYFGLLVYLKQL